MITGGMPVIDFRTPPLPPFELPSSQKGLGDIIDRIRPTNSINSNGGRGRGTEINDRVV